MYGAAPAVLLAVAKELAQKAKDSLPKLHDGERVLREWYADGLYCRETSFNGETFIRQYDFRQKENVAQTGDVKSKEDGESNSKKSRKRSGGHSHPRSA